MQMCVAVAIEKAVDNILNVLMKFTDCKHKVNIIEGDTYVVNYKENTWAIQIREIEDILDYTTQKTVTVLFVQNGKILINDDYNCEPRIQISILNNLHNIIDALMKGDYNENNEFVPTEKGALRR